MLSTLRPFTCIIIKYELIRIVYVYVFMCNVLINMYKYV